MLNNDDDDTKSSPKLVARPFAPSSLSLSLSNEQLIDFIFVKNHHTRVIEFDLWLATSIHLGHLISIASSVAPQAHTYLAFSVGIGDGIFQIGACGMHAV